MKTAYSRISSPAQAQISLVLLSVFVALVMSPMACGQILLERGENVAARARLELEEQKRMATRRMKMVISEIDRACELTDAQVKKLEIAVSGTVSNFVRSKLIEREKQWEALGFPIPSSGDDEETRVGGTETEEESKEAAPNRIMIGAFGQAYDDYPKIEEVELWKNTVAKVLTDEQIEKLEATTKRRQADSRRAAVERFIANVDRKLILSSAQRSKIFELVDKDFGNKLLATELHGPDMMEINMFMGLGERPDANSAPIDRQVIGAILSERQMEEWTHSIELQLNQLPSR